MVSSMMSSRFGEGFRQPSDREDIVYRDRGQLGLLRDATNRCSHARSCLPPVKHLWISRPSASPAQNRPSETFVQPVTRPELPWCPLTKGERRCTNRYAT